MPDPCSTCRFHVRHDSSEPGIRDGICHRYPIQVPKDDGDFCGEHRSASDATTERSERLVYKGSPESDAMCKARFPSDGPHTALSFEFDGHRWAYECTSFDDLGEYDVIWRPGGPDDA